MRLTCAVPYLAISASRPSTIAGRALSASIRTASLVVSWAMARSIGEDGPMVAPRRSVCGSPPCGRCFCSGFREKHRPQVGSCRMIGLLLKRAVAAQALVTLFQQVGHRHRLQLFELVQQ